MTAADKLISGLGSERERWSKELQDLIAQRKYFLGNCLLVAAFLSYTGAFNWEIRSRLLYDVWLNDLSARGIPSSADFKIEHWMVSDVERSQWVTQGLPSDDISMQNGILTTQGLRTPLCIDPQHQAVTWIRHRENGQELRVCSSQDRDLLKHLEMALSFGTSLLLELDDSAIDPMLDDVIERRVQVESGRKFVVLGEKEVDFDENFKLYLTTRQSNPKFSPKIFGSTRVINYCVTEKGLQDQLLNLVVRHERPELEAQRERLIQEMSENKRRLKALEDLLLLELAQSKGKVSSEGGDLRVL